MVNLPWLSVTAARFVPLTATVTPASGVPSSESTVPPMGTRWAFRLVVIMPNKANMIRLKSFPFLILLLFGFFEQSEWNLAITRFGSLLRDTAPATDHPAAVP